MLDEVGQTRGRPRFVLGVQVLESLHLNLLAGLEPRSWVDQDWIDYLIQLVPSICMGSASGKREQGWRPSSR